MNVITGLPRSGSTLLCNVLNQNPAFHASSTSPLALVITNLSNSFSEQPEFVSNLIKDKDSNERIKSCARALLSDWYRDRPFVFDKARGWSNMGLIYFDLFPEGKMVVMVRDPRDVYASMEKQHRKNPMLHGSNIISSQNLLARADAALSPEGMLGSCIVGVQDLIRRKLPVLFVKYEDFAEYPEREIDRLYKYLGTERHTHDFNSVVNTAEDVDELFHNKYPHRGEGEVNNQSVGMWRQYIDDGLAEQIVTRYPLFSKMFNYTQ